jgi:GDP-L-fucose synthase
LSELLLFTPKKQEKAFLNIGVREHLSIKGLSLMIRQVVGYRDDFVFDSTKPDGTPRKLMNVEESTSLAGKLES